MIKIIESNMVFEFEPHEVFCIEKSNLQAHIGDGIKTVEFVLHRKENHLEFVEAKSSSPRPTKENSERFDEFIDEISDKFVHSFNLYYSAALKRCEDNEIHENFIQMNHSQVKFKFILIIKGHRIEWLLPLKEALHRKLQYHITIWKSEVILMNEDVAKQNNLITSVL